jgi:hypothetical protein
MCWYVSKSMLSCTRRKITLSHSAAINYRRGLRESGDPLQKFLKFGWCVARSFLYNAVVLGGTF